MFLAARSPHTPMLSPRASGCVHGGTRWETDAGATATHEWDLMTDVTATPPQPVPVVLASQSPSRLGLLRNAGVEPIVQPAHLDEEALVASLGEATPEEIVIALATAKASAIAELRAAAASDEVIIGCDSMLLAAGELIGKPYTEAATIARWQRLRGTAAELITGHAVLRTQGGESQLATGIGRTVVHFGDLDDADIASYAATGEPWHCAGAFTLEALGSWFIDAIEGDPSSVIGLSMPLLRQLLAELGLRPAAVWNRVEV